MVVLTRNLLVRACTERDDANADDIYDHGKSDSCVHKLSTQHGAHNNIKAKTKQIKELKIAVLKRLRIAVRLSPTVYAQTAKEAARQTIHHDRIQTSASYLATLAPSAWRFCFIRRDTTWATPQFRSIKFLCKLTAAAVRLRGQHKASSAAVGA